MGQQKDVDSGACTHVPLERVPLVCLGGIRLEVADALVGSVYRAPVVERDLIRLLIETNLPDGVPMLPDLGIVVRGSFVEGGVEGLVVNTRNVQVPSVVLLLLSVDVLMLPLKLEAVR